MKKRIIVIIALILTTMLASAFLFETSSKEQIDKRPDADGDKIPDDEDAFPYDPAASLDSDGDGYPDRWNPGKSQKDSTSIPPLVLDDFPYDPSEWKDSDGDGVGDNSDAFPDDPYEWSDLDGDGIGDNSDINSNVDLAIGFKITKFKLTKRVDFLRWGQIYFTVKIDNQDPIKITNNGKNWLAFLHKIKNIKHDEIFYDIVDSTKERYTIIEITMYDADFLFADDIVDISKESDSAKLVLKFDNVENKLIDSGVSEGSKASIWYELTTNTEKEPNINYYSRDYQWDFGNKKWETSLKIPIETYKNYLDSKVNRMPQNQPSANEAMVAFVTSNDRVILDLSLKLKSFSVKANYDSITTANFILKFVQANIIYSLDNISKGCVEYWRFPIETLVDLEGDCEDTAVLYASIMDALNYDVALLYYMWDNEGQKLGHIAVGIHVEGNHEDYVLGENGKKYYYCETTNIRYNVGKIPADLKGDPIKIIYI